MIEFKITKDADQQFATVINRQRVTVRLWYAISNDRWSTDISVDNNPVLHGRRVVAGSDLLAAFDFGIGVMFAYSPSDSIPNREQLPNGLVKLYSATRDEVDAAMVA